MSRTIKEPVQYESLLPKIAKKTTAINKTVEAVDFKKLVKLSDHGYGQENLVKNIQEIFPDIDLAIELVTSLVTSPNDMGTGGLTYKLSGFKLPTEAQSLISGMIDTYAENTYGLSDKLNEIVEESLFKKGAYVELNIPPKNISDMFKTIKSDISVGVESLLMSQGDYIDSIKEDKDKIFKFTSNPSILAEDILNEKKANYIVNNTLSGESISPGLEALMIHDDHFGIMDDTDISSDKPIIKKMSPNKIIPITSQEDPSKHYGYFVLLKNKKKKQGKSSNPTSSDGLIAKVNNSLKSMTQDAPTIEGLDGLRDVLIKTKLKGYLDNSPYKDFSDLQFELDDDIVLDMADSIISKTPIDILFLPTNLVSYYAINFRENGMGESLLERLSVLMSMRAMLVFTKMLSYIKSSVTTTDVKVDLDPDDPEYKKSMEAIMAEIVRNRQISMPIGILNVDDLTDWVHKLGFSFNFKHPGLPDVNIDIEEKANEINPIDETLKEDIDKLIITSLYLTPEMIDNGYSPEFATTIIANNILLRKRILKLQSKYEKLLTKDIQKKLKVDGKFKSMLRSALSDMLNSKMKRFLVNNNNDVNKEALKKASDDDIVEYMITRVIDSIQITLPKPEVTEETNVADMVDKYTELLDNVIDKLFSSDLIPSNYLGTIGDDLDDLKGLIKHTLLRRYIDENNVLPDFSKMFTLDEDGKPMFNLLTDFNVFGKSLDAIIIPFLKENEKMVSKFDKRRDKIGNGEIEEEEEDNEFDNDDNIDDGGSETPEVNEDESTEGNVDETPEDGDEPEEPTDKIE